MNNGSKLINEANHKLMAAYQATKHDKRSNAEIYAFEIALKVMGLLITSHSERLSTERKEQNDE